MSGEGRYHRKSCIQAHVPIGVPQALDSDEAPEHPAPHELPAIQVRVLVCVPDPHFTEHAPHAPNALSLLLTETMKETQSVISIFLLSN